MVLATTRKETEFCITSWTVVQAGVKANSLINGDD